MAALTFGSLNCDQFTLPAGGMYFPLNVRSSNVTGSLKSGPHPTFGQISGSLFGVPQIVYMASADTAFRFTFMPIFARLAARTLPWFTSVEMLMTNAVTAGPVNVPFA